MHDILILILCLVLGVLATVGVLYVLGMLDSYLEGKNIW